MLVPCRKDSESSLDVVAEQARKALIPLSGNVYWYGTDELPADLVDPLRPLVLLPETKSVDILFKALPWPHAKHIYGAMTGLLLNERWILALP